MEYKYYLHSTDLKDLKHIEWFVLHIDEYSLQGEKSRKIFDRLKVNIHQKNIFYSDIVSDYEELVSLFNNDPYEYAFDLSGTSSQKEVQTDRINNYFIEVCDSEGTKCMVPYGYAADNKSNLYPKASVDFNDLVYNSKGRALYRFKAVKNHYLRYWEGGGVRDALTRFSNVHMGKDYKLISTSLFYLLYNILLMIILRETKFFSAVTHFWQFFSSDASVEFSALRLFGGHTWLGLLALIGTAYFLYYDVIYTHGIYYLIFVLNKYSSVRKYHDGVLRLYNEFSADYDKCSIGIRHSQIERVRNKERVYIPLIMKTSRMYDFLIDEVSYTNIEGKYERRVRRVPQPVLVTNAKFYKNGIQKNLIRMLALWLFVTVICSYSNILLY